jgi:hypothetical protein
LDVRQSRRPLPDWLNHRFAVVGFSVAKVGRGKGGQGQVVGG